jgi:hypothetical protein
LQDYWIFREVFRIDGHSVSESSPSVYSLTYSLPMENDRSVDNLCGALISLAPLGLSQVDPAQYRS